MSECFGTCNEQSTSVQFLIACVCVFMLQNNSSVCLYGEAKLCQLRQGLFTLSCTIIGLQGSMLSLSTQYFSVTTENLRSRQWHQYFPTVTVFTISFGFAIFTRFATFFLFFIFYKFSNSLTAAYFATMQAMEAHLWHGCHNQ